MTDFTWDGGGDGVAWSDPLNWVPDSGFPDDNGDRAIFDATADAVVTGAARTIGELQMNSGFTGSLTQTVGALTIDDAGAHDGSMNVNAGTFDANDLDINIDGNFLLASGGTIVMGAGSLWTVGGSWTSDNGTITEETSTIKMTGTGKTFISGTSGARQLATVEIAVGATISSSNGLRPQIYNGNGTLTLTGSATLQVMQALTMGSSGSVTGTGKVAMRSGTTITVGTGTIDTADLDLEGNITINPGTYGSATVTAFPGTTGARTLSFTAGTFVFSGDVTMESHPTSGTYTVNMNTNDPDVTFNGDLTMNTQGSATLNFNKGTGTLTFGGSALQTVTSEGEDLGKIAVTNVSAGGIALADAVNFDKLTANAASANILIKFDEAGAHTVDEFDLTGTGAFRVQLRSEVDANQWDVTTVGDQAVENVDVKDSNMSGGTYTVTGGTDSGNNSANWVFVAPPAPSVGEGRIQVIGII